MSDSKTGAEGSIGAGCTDAEDLVCPETGIGKVDRREQAARESGKRAGIRCQGGSGGDAIKVKRPSELNIGETGEEMSEAGKSLEQDGVASAVANTTGEGDRSETAEI